MPVKNTENGRAQADQRAAALGLSLGAVAFYLNRKNRFVPKYKMFVP